RYDGTSRFLSDNRWKFYPGVSAGWVVSKENFWEPLAQSFHFLKLRASYASLGDQSPMGYYPFFPSMSVTVPTSNNYYLEGTRLAAVSLAGLVDPSLTWITTTTLDLGIDMSFLKNRLNVTFGWYDRKMDDFVGPAEPLPAFLGTDAPQRNSTAIETKGWDLTVEWKDRISEVSYGIRGVLGDYRGVVKKYPNPTKLLSTWYEGQVMGEIWGYESDGLFQSAEEVASAPSQSLFWSTWGPGDVRYNDLNGDGKITNGTNTLDDPGDRRIIGNSTPRYSFGLTLSAEYKGFDALVFFNGVGKRDAWTTTPYFWSVNNNTSFLSEMHLGNYWTEETPNAYLPKTYIYDGQISKNQQTSTRYLQNAAYVRLKNIQFGYTLPSALSGKIKCKRLRVYMNGENIFSIMNKWINYSDPEYAGSATTYPNYRTWSAGLNITF
ncbi:MAG: SusC/RagA family TonB-linked outer membrane protein, partial [Tannerella sp.]|nr:SusC/RagA family TonB-linked outer membrane protein [Tannerella sp.]